MDSLLRTAVFVRCTFIDYSGPGVEFGARNAHQTARRVQPERLGIIFHDPMNSVAGQSVLAGKRGNLAVFHSAEPALRGSPKRTVPIESKLVDAALAQPVCG
jgi:hypothetical protein